jgi:hypothetical protein
VHFFAATIGGVVIGIVVGLVVLLIAFVWWRYTSVERGARQRNAKILPLLDPLGEKLADGKEPTAEEVDNLARNPSTRGFLYQALKHFERLDLFPERYRTEEAQAEAGLVYWMMHPNELQAAPREIQLVETVHRELQGQKCRFYVFRFQMPEGHRCQSDWLLGLSGPFIDNDPPYSGVAGSFSRCGDKYGAVQPGHLVDWYIDMFLRESRS